MSKIHTGLANRDILDGDASDYGLVRVTTCAVSGQLATDACAHDALGYGTVTDYWKAGTQPTVYCQMHVSQTVCADTGMPAGPYCPNPVVRGVITLPAGHPLYNYLGTKYQSVIEQYLGTAAAASGQLCTWHTAENQGTGLSPTTARLVADAEELLANARMQMETMDPTSAHYQAISQAAAYLSGLIAAENPSQNDVAAAMSLLTQAMVGTD